MDKKREFGEDNDLLIAYLAYGKTSMEAQQLAALHGRVVTGITLTR